MCSKMMQFKTPAGKPPSAAAAVDEDDEDSPTAQELARMRLIYTEKFR